MFKHPIDGFLDGLCGILTCTDGELVDTRLSFCGEL